MSPWLIDDGNHLLSLLAHHHAEPPPCSTYVPAHSSSQIVNLSSAFYKSPRTASLMGISKQPIQG